MADVFDQYAMAEAWDEMFVRPGEPRPAYRSLFATLQPLSVADLRARADQLARVFTDRGVTFAYAGEERPFPLDLIPRIISAAEWDLVTRAVRQRVTALERFLADVYGPGEVFADGVVPRKLITTSAHFARERFPQPGCTRQSSSRPARTSPGRPWASSRPPAYACMSAASPSPATRRATSGSSRTPCPPRPECRTSSRTAAP